jgi:hypothetical protein
MATLIHPILLVIPVLAWFLYTRIRWLRFEQYKMMPRPPPSLVLGHLKAVGEAVGKLEKDVHSGMYSIFDSSSDD